MRQKNCYFILLALIACSTARSQEFLKKVKEKAATAIDKPAADKTKAVWCDSISAATNAGYSLAYSSPVNFSIMYDESRLGLQGNKNNYRLVLKQQLGNKPQFVIVENGKVTATLATLSADDIPGGIRQPLDGLGNASDKSASDKYMIAETTSTTVAGQTAKTVATPQSINANQISSAFEMMKNTPEYKKMSADEKKEVEEAMKQMPQAATNYNNSGLAGKTISTPEIKAGTYTAANGYYNITVKGKNYGRFGGQPQIKVSADETNVYVVGTDDKGKTSFIANDKQITLAATKAGDYMPHTGSLLMSADGKKAAFAEVKPTTAKEQEEMLKVAQTGATVKQNFIVTKSDGTTYQLSRADGGDKFKVTNSGAVVYVNTKTGEVVADGKKIGKFAISGTEELNSDALLFGSDASKISYYSETGSLSYMDGSKKDMGILFPQVITENGKSFITWFRKCRNDIYIGKIEF